MANSRRRWRGVGRGFLPVRCPEKKGGGSGLCFAKGKGKRKVVGFFALGLGNWSQDITQNLYSNSALSRKKEKRSPSWKLCNPRVQKKKRGEDLSQPEFSRGGRLIPWGVPLSHYRGGGGEKLDREKRSGEKEG